MRIDSSNVGMESARTYQSSSTRKLSVSVKTVQFHLNQGALSNYDLLGNSSTESNEEVLKNASDEENTLSDDTKEDALSRLKSSQASNAGRIQSVSNDTAARSIDQIRQKCILYLWSIFFGQDKAEQMSKDYGFSTDTSSFYASTEETNINLITTQVSDEYAFSETEQTDFSTTGTVKTADGREINFNLDVSMSRSFEQYYKKENVNVAAMCDPLVINLDDSIAGLSDQKFYFDLDQDGEKEEISTLENGNGFLSLDKNHDGIINDGSELFGTKSGDGFRDLAKYDEDHNGWIDENDSVYDDLKIWVKDGEGNDSLYSLKEKNVGAIYLGHQDTNFTLRSENTGDVNGAIRKTGVFLYEDGAAGTISHLDIAN